MNSVKLVFVSTSALVATSVCAFAGPWCTVATYMPNVSKFTTDTSYATIGSGIEMGRSVGQMIFCALGW